MREKLDCHAALFDAIMAKQREKALELLKRDLARGRETTIGANQDEQRQTRVPELPAPDHHVARSKVDELRLRSRHGQSSKA